MGDTFQLVFASSRVFVVLTKVGMVTDAAHGLIRLRVQVLEIENEVPVPPQV